MPRLSARERQAEKTEMSLDSQAFSMVILRFVTLVANAVPLTLPFEFTDAGKLQDVTVPLRER